MTLNRLQADASKSRESNIVVCLTHDDQSYLLQILKCIARTPRAPRAQAVQESLPGTKLPNSSSPRPSLRLEEIDAALNQKIVSHQQQAASQSQHSMDLKRLSRKIIKENKELMGRSSYLLESSRRFKK